MKFLLKVFTILLLVSTVAPWKITVKFPINVDETEPDDLVYETEDGIETGKGSCGSIIIAKDAAGKRVAIKFVHPLDSSGKKKSVEFFDKHAKILRNEFLAYQYLFKKSNNAYCPGIVEAICAGIGNAIEGNGNNYYLIVMAYYPVTLTEHANLLDHFPPDNGILSQEDSIRYTLEIFDIMKILKFCGMVHHDIKPDNLMVDFDGKLRLIDFGYAFFPGAEFEKTEKRGTPIYQHMDDWDKKYPGSLQRNDLMPLVYTMIEFEVGTPKLLELIIDAGKGAVGKDRYLYEIALGKNYWLPYSKRNFAPTIERTYSKKPKLGGIVLEMHTVATMSIGEINYEPHVSSLRLLQKEITQSNLQVPKNK